MSKIVTALFKQAISDRERALCQLTVCFEFQSRSDRRKGHKSSALDLMFKHIFKENIANTIVLILVCYS